MLYFLLQPASDDEENLSMPSETDLPPKVNKIMRQSLSMEQNEVINLAARLAQGLEDTPVIQSSADGPATAEARNDRWEFRRRSLRDF